MNFTKPEATCGLLQVHENNFHVHTYMNKTSFSNFATMQTFYMQCSSLKTKSVKFNEYKLSASTLTLILKIKS